MRTATNPETGERVYFDERAGEWRSFEEGRDAAGWQLPGVAAAVGQGLSFGLLDEGAAGLRAAVLAPFSDRTFGELYDEGLTAQRLELQDARERAPALSAGAEVAGALAPALVTGGASLAARAPQAAQLGVGRMAALGAAGGALGGFGNAEGGALERAEGALVGGAIGAAAGPVVKGITNAGGAVARSARDMAGLSPARTAADRVAEALSDDGLDAAGVAAEMARRGTARGERAFDVAGERSATMALVENVVNNPGPMSRQIAREVEERVATQSGRIADDFADAFGTQRQFFESLDELDRARRAAASPLYDRAYEAGAEIADDGVISLIESGRLPASPLRTAERLARLEGAPLPRIVRSEGGEIVVEQAPSLQHLDYVKRALDDQITTARRAGRNNEVRLLEGVRDDLVSTLDDLIPDYAAARSAWAGPTALREAMEEGLSAGSLRPQEIRRRLATMGESERDAFVTGMYEATLRRLEDVPDTADAARRVWVRSSDRQRIRAAIEAIEPDADAAAARFSALDDAMQREMQLAAARNQITANAATARRTATRERLNPSMGAAAADIVAGTPGLMSAGMAGGRMVGGSVRDRVASRLNDELGRLLMQSDPAAFERMMLSANRPPLPFAGALVPDRIGYGATLPYGLLGGLGAENEDMGLLSTGAGQ